MINRVLIRIKVVQMLYCYLLTQNVFKIESTPESASRDKQYAYSVYLDLLLIILRISGCNIFTGAKAIPGVGDNRYLSGNKMVRALQADSDVRAIAFKRGDLLGGYNDAVSAIYSEIVKSAAYRSYIRQKNLELKDDVAFWITIINTIVAKNPELMEAARRSDGFTIAGYEQGIAMLVATLENFSDTRTMFIDAKKSLARSLDKAYELYHALLLLPVEITRMQDMRLDNARNKYLATDEDLNPNTRFVDNVLVKMLSECDDMKSYLSENPISWNDDTVLIRTLLDKIMQSQIYAEYMESAETGLAADCDFWRAIFKHVILPSEELSEALEQKSVYWNDDLDIIGTFVLKTIKRISNAEGKMPVLLPKYKDDEDAKFGNELFIDTVENFTEYRSYIDRFIDASQWDPERLAFMDVVIMSTAISELLNYPAIPIPVTLNEYIEIANCYSTPRSGHFVNGMLYSIINYLKNEGRLNKN